ncbi:3'-phosphoadenylsulfate reductase [Brettanomyces nanus]|uniref:phosphoadenylyl-sulfate reductase (thioredoxin) n=1 Tax=Eeniella nana TaxID=13502 RepID=A0A875S6B0_EENNA|nr:3'-phosphoadenylsulfate reductase [Brettanomyces nanus]QPG77131.1 3'-phosphoadenylsulfate reductase [Brettanomyces nanus]
MSLIYKDTLKISQAQLDHWNKTLSNLNPDEIIKWAILTFPNLYQTTAFGLSGLCILDILNKLGFIVELVFIDTLYHFPQTLDLISKVKTRYPDHKLHVFKPEGCYTEEQFRDKYGDELWEKDQLKYDFVAKVEPLERAYKQLNIQAVFTGRRRSQGAARAQLPVVDIDEAVGIVKINPLVNWSFEDVQKYIKLHNVPYNELLDLGYKSVGDWHSTSPVKEGEDERSGRWKGQVKTECGIHQTSKYRKFSEQEEQLDK